MNKSTKKKKGENTEADTTKRIQNCVAFLAEFLKIKIGLYENCCGYIITFVYENFKNTITK